MMPFSKNISEGELIKELEQLRWGNNTKCPHCSSTKIVDYIIENKFQCEHCFRSFSVFSKTEFENTKLPISTWLLAYYLIKEHKEILPNNLNKWLNVTQKTSATVYDKVVKMINEQNWFNKISESQLYRNQVNNFYSN